MKKCSLEREGVVTIITITHDHFDITKPITETIIATYLGKGTMLTASFLRSALSWPGKRRLVVTPDMVRETRWFRSP